MQQLPTSITSMTFLDHPSSGDHAARARAVVLDLFSLPRSVTSLNVDKVAFSPTSIRAFLRGSPVALTLRRFVYSFNDAPGAMESWTDANIIEVEEILRERGIAVT